MGRGKVFPAARLTRIESVFGKITAEERASPASTRHKERWSSYKILLFSTTFRGMRRVQKMARTEQIGTMVMKKIADEKSAVMQRLALCVVDTREPSVGNVIKQKLE